MGKKKPQGGAAKAGPASADENAGPAKQKQHPGGKEEQTAIEHGIYARIPPALLDKKEQLMAMVDEAVGEPRAVHRLDTVKAKKDGSALLFGLLRTRRMRDRLVACRPAPTLDNYAIVFQKLWSARPDYIRADQHLSQQEDATDLPAGVAIEGVVAGRTYTVAPGEQVKFSIRVSNNGTFDEYFRKVSLSENGSPSSDLMCQTKPALVPKAGGVLPMTVGVRASGAPGISTYCLAFHFENRRDRQVFFDVATVSATASGVLESGAADPSIYAETGEDVPFTYDSAQRTIVPAFSDARPNPMHMHSEVDTEWVKRLGLYEVPAAVLRDLEHGDHYRRVKAWKTRENYKTRLHDLLWVEEAQQMINMRRFDLKRISIEGPLDSYRVGQTVNMHDPEYPVFRIPVPGLQERRPSVLAHDSLYVWRDGTQDWEYEAWVRSVEKEAVLVHLPLHFEKHHDLSAVAFNGRFTLPRISMRRMHAAIDNVDLDVVWPAAAAPRPLPNVPLPRSCDALTEEQRAAVLRIIDSPGIPVQVIGAFGTGKSHTILSAVSHLVQQYPRARILLCTEANGAADDFAMQLLDKLPDEHKACILRQYRFQYEGHWVPPQLRDNTVTARVRGAELVDYPSLEAMHRYRVVVCTAESSSTFFGIGIGKTFWSHIIIDEAAQMMEPKCLVPLQMACAETTVVLAGDVKQVGPKMQSISASQHGLQLSILERDMACHKYELLQNYRNHPAILEMPSRWFYDGRLQAMRKDIAYSKNWGKFLPNVQCPVVFVPVHGMKQADADSPSIYNIFEADQTVSLVKKLVHELKLVAKSSVSVLAPYAKQLQKIRYLLRENGLAAVDVGPLDSIQGKEKEAVLISCVSSRRDASGVTESASVGFVGEARRLNTAMTRAIKLLVIVGDPFCLSKDKHLRSFMQYCKDNGSVITAAPNRHLQEEIAAHDQAAARAGTSAHDTEHVTATRARPSGGGGSSSTSFGQHAAAASGAGAFRPHHGTGHMDVRERAARGPDHAGLADPARGQPAWAGAAAPYAAAPRVAAAAAVPAGGGARQPAQRSALLQARAAEFCPSPPAHPSPPPNPSPSALRYAGAFGDARQPGVVHAVPGGAHGQRASPPQYAAGALQHTALSSATGAGVSPALWGGHDGRLGQRADLRAAPAAGSGAPDGEQFERVKPRAGGARETLAKYHEDPLLEKSGRATVSYVVSEDEQGLHVQLWYPCMVLDPPIKEGNKVTVSLRPGAHAAPPLAHNVPEERVTLWLYIPVQEFEESVAVQSSPVGYCYLACPRRVRRALAVQPLQSPMSFYSLDG